VIYDTREPEIAIDLPPDAREPWVWLRFACEGAEAAVADLVRRHGRCFRLAAEAGALCFLCSLRGPRISQPILGPASAAELVVRFLSLLDQDLAPAAGNGLVRRARRLLDAGLERGIAVKQVAAQLRVTPEHLTRSFHRELGESPSAYLRRAWLRRAERLLADPRQSVAQVAARLGYATPSHFARAFRAGSGQSPQGWRRRGGDLA
jgi:transcriptional regulator GlxA family with amidase domain